MLRTCAHNAFGWRCDEGLVGDQDIERPAGRSAYPASRPRRREHPTPPGTHPLTNSIEQDARKRLARIKDDIENAGPFYTREQVRAVLEHWKISL